MEAKAGKNNLEQRHDISRFVDSLDVHHENHLSITFCAAPREAEYSPVAPSSFSYILFRTLTDNKQDIMVTRGTSAWVN